MNDADILGLIKGLADTVKAQQESINALREVTRLLRARIVGLEDREATRLSKLEAHCDN